MKLTAHVLMLLAIASCTLQREEMFKGHPQKGTGYAYTVLQLGGQFAGESSSGTKAAVNNEGSFKDFMATLGVAVAGWSAASIQKAKEVTAQYTAGEITKREAAAQAAAIQQAEIAAKSAATSEAIGAGAEIAPITITPP